jgi:hypothetical protein
MRPFTHTPQILIETGRAHFKGSFLSLRLVLLLAYCVVVGVGVAIYLDTPTWLEFAAFAGGLTSFGILIFALIFAIVYFWQIPHQARQNFDIQKALSRVFVATWDDAIITIKSDSHQSTDAIGDFAFWLQARGHVMLYRSRHIYNVVAAEAFETVEERDDLIAKLTAAGVKPR